jgi:hypothetical protein
MNTDQLAGLPSAADFADIEVPEFARKYVKRQGPASTKTNPRGRTFSASGPKADLIAKMIFADMGLTRSQMATIAKCSPSRVSEVIWAMEAAVKAGQIEGFPAVPTKPVLDEPEAEDEPEGMTEQEIADVVNGPAELAAEIREALESDEQS